MNMIVRTDKRIKPQPDPPRRHKLAAGLGCPFCDRERAEGNSFHPPHDAARGCESGHHEHCSCDVCF
jgi:hypothetical protein